MRVFTLSFMLRKNDTNLSTKIGSCLVLVLPKIRKNKLVRGYTFVVLKCTSSKMYFDASGTLPDASFKIQNDAVKSIRLVKNSAIAIPFFLWLGEANPLSFSPETLELREIAFSQPCYRSHICVTALKPSQVDALKSNQLVKNSAIAILFFL